MLRTGFEIRGLDPGEAIEELDASVPIGRIAEPQEIVDVILFLLSDAAAYMCGSLVEVNGCLLYTSPSPRDRTRSRMPSSA